MAKHDFDILVIGSGPAGIHAAVQAAKLNKTVGIIEKTEKSIGGAWLHTGTLPSKTIREVVATIQSIKPHVGPKWVDRVIGYLSSESLAKRALNVSQVEETLVRKHLENNKIKIIQGFGRLEDQHNVRVTPKSGEAFLVSADYILIATGSKPRRPANIPFDDWRIVDSDGVLRLESLPSSIQIYGAGVIGCEYACIFGALGIKTTLIDTRTTIMQTADQEIAKVLKDSMEDMGIEILLGYKLKSMETRGPRVIVTYDRNIVESDIFFFAAGRQSTTENLGLERVGIHTDERGTIKVNEHFQTEASNIYAAGDAIGPPALASTSTEQGRIAVLHAFQADQYRFPKIYPIGIYTIPEVSSVGMTEEMLKQENIDYVVGRAGFDEVARGHIRGENHGLLKILVCTKTEKILGIHIVGADAANLIHIGLCFMLAEFELRMMVNSMLFNYPTLAEAYRVAAFNALNKLHPNGLLASEKKPKNVA
ncbi:MAG: Si-specific NAD(P)(+) transhydrogenase [Oligoflexales bacterium]